MAQWAHLSESLEPAELAARLESTHLTPLLSPRHPGQEHPREDVLPLVYEELRRLARSYLLRERGGHTLQATALVHEAYLRMAGQRRVDWKNRGQLVGLAAVMMRRVLVNHARERGAEKRGGEIERVTLSAAHEPGIAPEVDVLELHDALARLEAIDPRKGRVVELKFFGGLTTSEIADVLELSTATVEREWSFSKAWLYDAIGRDQVS
jgi:RNA polymerase sigma-70 factor, ECF subfamily